jgi:hypothetical protein
MNVLVELGTYSIMISVKVCSDAFQVACILLVRAPMILPFEPQKHEVARDTVTSSPDKARLIGWGCESAAFGQLGSAFCQEISYIVQIEG